MKQLTDDAAAVLVRPRNESELPRLQHFTTEDAKPLLLLFNEACRELLLPNFIRDLMDIELPMRRQSNALTHDPTSPKLRIDRPLPKCIIFAVDIS
jgi:hypothetical protein